MSRVLYGLLGLVALAAVVLSFDALHGLALLCGFSRGLAPLLPVTIDAGAAAGSLVWLTRPPGAARVFGRALALVLLAGSVAGNALGHGLDAYAARPAWWVVVVVSAVPPAVLAAVIHLGVLAARPAAHPGPAQTVPVPAADRAGDDGPASAELVRLETRRTDRAAELIAAGAGRRRLARELDISEHEARQLLAGQRPGAVS